MPIVSVYACTMTEEWMCSWPYHMKLHRIHQKQNTFEDLTHSKKHHFKIQRFHCFFDGEKSQMAQNLMVPCSPT